jgi:hypothetical protein
MFPFEPLKHFHQKIPKMVFYSNVEAQSIKLIKNLLVVIFIFSVFNFFFSGVVFNIRTAFEIPTTKIKRKSFTRLLFRSRYYYQGSMHV